MSRSQLRIQICQTSKSGRQEWQSLVILNGTNIFLDETNISFLKFICGILNRDMANSFWNHVIQISSRQTYFKDIFQSVKSKNIWWKYLLLKIKYIFFRDSYVCPTWIFMFDSDQAQINSVCIRGSGSPSTRLWILKKKGKMQIFLLKPPRKDCRAPTPTVLKREHPPL